MELVERESAIFERVPLLSIRPRYSSAAATTTKIFMENSSDMNADYKHIEIYTVVCKYLFHVYVLFLEIKYV